MAFWRDYDLYAMIVTFSTRSQPVCIPYLVVGTALQCVQHDIPTLLIRGRRNQTLNIYIITTLILTLDLFDEPLEPLNRHDQ
jgi:hypothetical protein